MPTPKIRLKASHRRTLLKNKSTNKESPMKKYSKDERERVPPPKKRK